MEAKLVADIRSELRARPVSVSALGEQLHGGRVPGTRRRDSVTAAQLRTALRAAGLALSGRAVAGLMRAASLDSAASYSVAAVLDIMGKATEVN